MATHAPDGDGTMVDGVFVPVEFTKLSMATAVELVVSELSQLARELAHNTDTSGIADVLLASTDQPHAGPIQPDSPIHGQSRVILTDRRGGGLYTLPATVAVGLLSASNGRTGGQIVNAGANPITLYLATPAEVGAGNLASLPQIVLNVGGFWNLLLSKVFWAGSVTAVSTVGSSASVATT